MGELSLNKPKVKKKKKQYRKAQPVVLTWGLSREYSEMLAGAVISSR